MRRFVIVLLTWIFIGLAALALGLKADNSKPDTELLDAMILVNEHNGLSDWGLEQMDLLLDAAGYDRVFME